jgi:hypothetical protein
VYEKFGAATRQSFTPTLAINQWRVYNVRSGGGTIKAFLDGVQQVSASVTNSFEAEPNLFDWSSNGWTGHIAELLVFDRVLSATERNQVLLDLNTEYGFTVPYEIASATVAAVATVGTPTVTNVTLVTPTTVSGTATVGAPALPALEEAGTVQASATVPAPVSVGQNPNALVQPDVVAAVTTVGAPSFPSREEAATVAATATVGSVTFVSSTIAVVTVVTATATVGGGTPVNSLAKPNTVPITATVGSAEVNPLQIPTVTVSAATSVGTPIVVGNLRIIVSKVSAAVSIPVGVVRELQISASTGLGALSGTVEATDTRTGWVTTITSPITSALVTSGGITVYGTVLAADNVEAEMHVQISTSPVFATILAEGYSAGVDPGEVASVSLAGLAAGTTYYVRARGGHRG